MDVAYNQHASSARRKNRSSTNLNHLTLAPLTSKLPLADHDYDLPDPLSAPPVPHSAAAAYYMSSSSSVYVSSSSYLQGKSAPTTPRLLSRSPAPNAARSRSHGAAPLLLSSSGLPKSKSTTYLSARRHHPRSGTVSPGNGHGNGNNNIRRRRNGNGNGNGNGSGDDHTQWARSDRSDADWLLRAGALISAEARESKGQAWLVSRASSTSLTARDADADEAALERELARERELASRRGSIATVIPDGDINNNNNNNNNNNSGGEEGGYYYSSPPHSRFGSRSHSRAGSVRTGGSGLWSPVEQQQQQQRRRSLDGGYFVQQVASPDSVEDADEDEAYLAAGPDFVNLDERLEMEAYELEAAVEQDEAHVRRLLKKHGGGNGGVGAWFGSVLGFQLFSVEENEEEEEDDDEEEEDDEDQDDDVSSDAVQGDDDNNDGVVVSASGGGLRGGRAGKEGRRRSSSTSVRRFEGPAGPLVEERMPPPKADEGGWHDAAWLLSVASKVLL